VKLLDPFQSSIYNEFSPELPVVPDVKEGKEMTEQEQALAVGMKLITLPGMPKASILRFLVSLLKLSYEAKEHYKTYTHFWLLFQEYASVSTQMRQFILSSGILRLFCHIYLGEESPYFIGQKIDRTNKEIVTQARLATQNMKYLLGAISIITCSCKMPRDNDTHKSPTEVYGDLLELSQEDKSIIFAPSFLYQVMSDDSNNDAATNIARHMSWENHSQSLKLIDTICDGVHKLDAERFTSFLYVLKGVLSLPDSLQEIRVEYAMAKLIRVISDNIQYRNATRVAINFFVEYIPVNKLVADYLIKHMDWIKQWLCYTTESQNKQSEELVRYTAEAIIQELVPEVKGYIVSVKPELIPTSSKTNAKLPELTEKALSRLHIIYRTLLSLLSMINQNTLDIHITESHNSTEIDYSPFRFVSLLRILHWCIISQTEKDMLLEKDPQTNREYKAIFFEAYQAIESKNLEKDCNKKEFLRVWDKLTTDNPRLISLFAEDKAVRTSLFYTKVSLNSSKTSLLYNNESLPTYYGLLHRFASASEVFRQELFKHSNFEWAIKYVLLSSDYPKAATVIEQTVILSLRLPNFRKHWIVNMHQTYIPNATDYRAVFDLLARLLQEEQEQIYFCSMGGYQRILEVLILKRKSWPLDDLRAVVTAATASIKWFKNIPSDNKDLESLQNRMVTDGYLDKVANVVLGTLSDLNSTHVQYVNAMSDFLIEAMAYDPNVTRRAFQGVYHYKLPSYDVSSEWRKIYVLLSVNIAERVLQNMPSFLSYLYSFVIYITKESLNHSIDTLFTCLKLLWNILINHSSQIDHTTQKEEYTRHLMDITFKLLCLHYDKVLDENKLIYDFISLIYPQIQPYMTTEKK